MHQTYRRVQSLFFVLSFCCSFVVNKGRRFSLTHDLQMRLPTEIIFQPNQLEILRVLGKIDVMIDRNTIDEVKSELQKQGDSDLLKDFIQIYGSSQGGRATSVRIFEARLIDGTRCFVKEYLPIGLLYGKRELSVSRKLSARWRQFHNQTSSESVIDTFNDDDDKEDEKEEESLTNELNTKFELDKDISNFPPFPVLLGYLKTDERISDINFKTKWAQRFPRTKPPESGNIWIVFRWDEASFKTLKLFPSLPQLVEGLDYFQKKNRIIKRWKFIRVLMRRILETVDFFHRNGYCHNAISTESLWMSTTNQQEIRLLRTKLTDLGVCQKLSDLGPYAKKGIFEDLYQVGLIFLQTILASFSDDFQGANNARSDIARAMDLKMQKNLLDSNLFDNLLLTRDNTQLTQRELQSYVELYCEEDLPTLRSCIKGIKGWEDAVSVLERDEGAGWKLIFKLLARGRLYDNSKDKQIRITAIGLIRNSPDLFDDTYSL